MMEKRIAIIAAGGLGTRMNCHKPKSLISFNGSTYLSILLYELSFIELDKIMIFCDQKRFVNEIFKISNIYNNTEIMIDSGSKSTFEVFKKGATLFPNSEFLFLYGHSPRHRLQIKHILDIKNPYAVSFYEKSSRKKTIMKDGNFIEPPFKIRCDYNLISNIQNWEDFFKSYEDDIIGVNFRSPPEFNTLDEQKAFDSYLLTWHRFKNPFYQSNINFFQTYN